jgi:glycosyltransferase involved in cell wall biosynthesis
MLSIIIPAYNEERRLPHALDLLTKFFKQAQKKELRGVAYEIVIALDGPLDNTPQIAGQWARRNNAIRVVQLEHRGKGWAVANGLKAAHGDAIVYDADAATPPREILKVVRAFSKSDVVVGSRRVPGAVVSGFPIFRTIASRTFNLLVRLLFGLNISDTQCGFKGIRNEARRRIAPMLSTGGWTWDVEMLYLAKKAGYRMEEIPIEWHHVSGGLEVAGTLKTSLRMFRELLALRLRLR